MKFKLISPEHTSDRLSEIVTRILSINMLCSMATTGGQGEPHIFTAFYSFDEALTFHFLSHPESAHARNLARDPRMSMAVFDERQPWGAAHVGLQLFGRCALAPDRDQEAIASNYTARFPLYEDFSNRFEEDGSAKAHVPFFDLRFYTFTPDSVKILDEPDFGDQVLVVARVQR